ncbi:MAG: Sec-independent protein translocase subunit TatB [Proteobacteria bacterium]|nr:Sec-independent protein translocase subunit TatB [Pseudomonadota bacterium]
MLDIGLTKMLLVGAVALVVIGPEKLPTVARMAGSLFGRAQRYLNQVKAEVSREIELDELRKMQQGFQEAAGKMEKAVADNLASVENTIHSAWHGDAASVSLQATPTPDQMALKLRNFRRKKLARTSAVPGWYKQQNGRKTRIISAAARVAKYRPGSAGKSSSFY